MAELSEWSAGIDRLDRELVWLIALPHVLSALVRFECDQEDEPQLDYVDFLRPFDVLKLNAQQQKMAERLLSVALRLPTNPPRRQQEPVRGEE